MTIEDIFQLIVLHYAVYFSEHPEYFVLIKGKCSTAATKNENTCDR